MACATWSYCKGHGPAEWSAIAPAAKGWHQSPVNIVTSDAIYDPNLTGVSSLKIHYIPGSCRRMLNNGHSVQVCVDGKGSGYLISWIENGPYRHRYQLEQFHFHWGRSDKEGSEHTLDGKIFSAELHLVHWNIDLFKSFGEAAQSADGLAVLGVFLEVGNEHNYLKKLTDVLPRVAFSGDSVGLTGGFDPTCLLPNDRTKYFTYCGSLTTPPCFESVRFLMFSDPIEVSESQLLLFRQLRSYKRNERPLRDDEFCGKILENFRPVQPLNDRKITRSFQLSTNGLVNGTK